MKRGSSHFTHLFILIHLKNLSEVERNPNHIVFCFVLFCLDYFNETNPQKYFPRIVTHFTKEIY